MTMTAALPAAPSRLATPRARESVRSAVRFVAVGTAGTVVYLGLYVIAAFAMDVVVANVAAWLVSTIATNEAHRRVTFRVAQSRRGDSAVSMITSLVGLGVSSVSVDLVAEDSTTVQLAMLVLGTATSGMLRFVALHLWFAGRSDRVVAA